MNRITSLFTQEKHKALIAYVTVGYPDITATREVIPLLAASGCDMIELGIPFSDPLADGVTIQQASYHALQNGVNVPLCLKTAAELREKIDIPLVFMGYFNPVYSYGVEKFCRECRQAGVDGMIIPDLPPEESSDMEIAAEKEELNLIYLLAPSSTDERVRMVAERAQGFIYLVSVTGVTGARTALPAELGTFVSRVRKATDKPLCVGFGISTPEQARNVADIADGVIVGSQIIRLIEDSRGDYTRLQEFVHSLRSALDK